MTANAIAKRRLTGSELRGIYHNFIVQRHGRRCLIRHAACHGGGQGRSSKGGGKGGDSDEDGRGGSACESGGGGEGGDGDGGDGEDGRGGGGEGGGGGRGGDGKDGEDGRGGGGESGGGGDGGDGEPENIRGKCNAWFENRREGNSCGDGNAGGNGDAVKAKAMVDSMLKKPKQVEKVLKASGTQ